LKKADEAMIIDKYNLQKISSICLGLANNEDFEIEGNEIIEIYLKYDKDKYEKNVFRVIGGYIELSAAAKNTVSSFFAENENIVEPLQEEDFRLCKRISGYCNICDIDIIYKDGGILNLRVPYDPLCESLYGNEIEWSNCPSVEWLTNENLKIHIGEYSRAPKRIDNNYNELILGWKNITNEVPKILKCRLLHFSSSNHLCPRLKITFSMIDGSKMHLIFEDYDNLECDYNTSFGDRYFHLLMSRMNNGRIFVRLDGIGVQFQCVCIKEDEYLSGKEYYGDDFNIASYRAAARLETDEETMALIASNHPAFEGDWLDLENIRKAITLYNTKTISLKYLEHWLKFYSEILAFCLPSYTLEGKISSDIAFILDRLQIYISYDYGFEKTVEILKIFMHNIEMRYNSKSENRLETYEWKFVS